MLDYRLTGDAISDLEEIRQYITKRDSEYSADNLEIQFFEAFDELVLYPIIGHKRFDVKHESMLFHNVAGYTIGFRREPRVVILGVVHGARDMSRVF